MFEAPVTSAQFHPKSADTILIVPSAGAPIQVRLEGKHQKRSVMSIPNLAEESAVKKYYIPHFYIICSAALTALYDRDGDSIYVATPSGKIHIYSSADTTSVISTFEIGGSVVHDMALSPDNRYMLTNSKDRTLRLISISSSGELHIIHKFQDLVNRVQWTCITFSSDCEYVVAGCTANHNLYMWERTSGSLVKILEGPREPSYALAWHPSRPIVASVSSYGLVYLWSKTQEENWSSFAPGFTELETNTEYAEREDEFDRVPDAEISERKRLTEDVVVDIISCDALDLIEELPLRKSDIKE
jgi:COMPASS component SWD1